VLGGGFLALLFANRNYQRPPPPDVAGWGPPKRALRLVSCDVMRDERGPAGVTSAIRQLDPDVVLLQGVERRDLSSMTEALGTFPAVYHASENIAGAHASWGNAILSRLPLYDVGTIPNPGGGGSFGVWATAVGDGTKFRVASIRLSSRAGEPSDGKEGASLIAAWQAIGSPPIVIGGDFHDPRGSFKPAGLEQPLDPPIDAFLISKQWKGIEGGAVKSTPSGGAPSWLSATGR
jgi:endonuclease/exonuclease/phosphatase (EEP) superfamily protein YafD